MYTRYTNKIITSKFINNNINESAKGYIYFNQRRGEGTNVWWNENEGRQVKTAGNHCSKDTGNMFLRNIMSNPKDHNTNLHSLKHQPSNMSQVNLYVSTNHLPKPLNTFRLDMFTNQLPNYIEQSPPSESVTQPLKKSLAIYWSRRSITMFTRARLSFVCHTYTKRWPDDGCKRFLQNAGIYQSNYYTASLPRRFVILSCLQNLILVRINVSSSKTYETGFIRFL
jgi:hypothetical protein